VSLKIVSLSFVGLFLAFIGLVNANAQSNTSVAAIHLEPGAFEKPWKESFAFPLSGDSMVSGEKGLWWAVALSNSGKNQALVYGAYGHPSKKKTIDSILVREKNYHILETLDLKNFDSFSREQFLRAFRNDYPLFGSSTELITTLAAIDGLVSRVSGGLKVGGTGSLDSEGAVLPVGGLSAKTHAGILAEVDVFFVPDLVVLPYDSVYFAFPQRGVFDMLEQGEMHRNMEGVFVVEVKSIYEALAYLCGRGGEGSCRVLGIETTKQLF